MKIKYSAQAKRDLLGISKYITDSLYNPKSASSTAEMIMKEISRLEDSPYVGTPVVFEFTEIVGVRVIRYKNYGAFYRISENIVYIDRVLYLKRDYMKLF